MKIRSVWKRRGDGLRTRPGFVRSKKDFFGSSKSFGRKKRWNRRPGVWLGEEDISYFAVLVSVGGEELSQS